MNFGDRLKQLRTQKNLTQPQLAQAIGIEQSYLSKLENDKSVPGADIFQAILRALQIDVATFLQGVDENIVHRELRQVPEVANHLNAQSHQRVHHLKKWLFASGIAGALGLTLFVAGYKDLLISGWQYTYVSPGVIHPDEPSDVFSNPDSWAMSKVRTITVNDERYLEQKAEILSRMKIALRTLREHRGDAFIEQVPGGSRIFKLRDRSYQELLANRILTTVGLLLTFASLFGFIVEWRLRTLKRS
jgi:transcriptional regulator with XRE-family HTH domain